MDLAIAAVSSAGVTVAVAIVIGVISLKLNAARSREAEALIAKARLEAELAIVKAQANALTDRAQLAEKRLRDADQLIAEMGSQLPVDGSFERLLRSWQRAKAFTAGTAANDNSDAMRDAREPTAGNAGSGELLKPGDDP